MISLIGEASEQKNSGEDPMITNGSMFITGFIALANISNEPSLFEEIDKERNDAPIRTIEKDHALLDECKGIKKTTSTAEASAVCLNCQTLSSKLQDMQEKYKRQ